VQFWHILSKFGCHGNSLCSLKNSDSTLQFAEPENLQLQFLDLLRQTEITAILADFFLKFGCHGNSLGCLKFFIAYMNSLT